VELGEQQILLEEEEHQGKNHHLNAMIFDDHAGDTLLWIP